MKGSVASFSPLAPSPRICEAYSISKERWIQARECEGGRICGGRADPNQYRFFQITAIDAITATAMACCSIALDVSTNMFITSR